MQNNLQFAKKKKRLDKEHVTRIMEIQSDEVTEFIISLKF